MQAARTGNLVRVFERDPDLLAGVDPRSAALLVRRVAVPELEVGRGRWAPGRTSPPDDAVLGLLVLDGLLVRATRLHGRDCAELLGTGDLLRPWDELVVCGIETSSSWRVLQPARLAVLEPGFARVAGRWPSITSALLERAALRARGLALNLAIAHIRQAEERLRVLFSHLAERWGRVTSAGVVVALPLTHELLGQLVCLHRPTTSAALSRLVRAGEIARTPDGGWLLCGEPPSAASPRAAGDLELSA